MLFTNHRSRAFTIPLKNEERKVTIVRPQPTLVEKRKIKWGEPFWNLFHVMSEKIIEDERFAWKKTQFLNLVYQICLNIPCPDCAKHATSYLNGVNFSTIQTKEQLKNFFFNFHNMVNTRRGVPTFPQSGMEKYSRGDLIAIIQTFITHFENKHSSNRMISDDFHRIGVSKKLKEWFQTNLSWFSS